VTGRAWLGLGANLGDPAATLESTVDSLRGDDRFDELRASRLWRGPYVGPRGPQPDYWNLCLVARTTLAPAELLGLCRRLEREAGRTAGTHQLPRVLDIDVLLFDTLVLDEPGLVLPHPRMRERRFVLEPLAELDPELRLPPDGASVRELLARPEIAAQELVVFEPGPSQEAYRSER
jgi:2-amino-4-hydroxy-6-hydroxymethyldihydropteridine diphosphokinase